MSRHRVSVLLSSAYLFLLSSCSDLGTDISQQEEHRIIFGKSIDGLTINMDSTEVIDLLGPPNEILIGDFSGVIFLYTQGKHARLSVTIYTVHNSTRLQGVVTVFASAPYSGKSEDGVSIGSSRQMTLRFVGQPDESGEGSQAGSIVDRYFYDTNVFIILYSDGQIEAVGMSVLPK